MNILKRAHNFDDKTGKKYGDLLVLKFEGVRVSPNGKKKSLWKCKCICNKEMVVVSGNLSSGNTTNCGCKRDERLRFYVDSIIRKPLGEAAFNCVYSKYMYGAKKRSLSFDLDRNTFKALCLKICFYCGSIPKNIESAVNKNGSFVYNGIDRIDNTAGYYEKNCVTCCKICNLMKLNLTQDAFLEHVACIHKNMKRKKAQNVQK